MANFNMASPVDAGTITLTGTNWVVDFPNSVSLFWDTADKTNNTTGTLNEITNRTNNNDIILTFRQVIASTQNSSASGGLRVNFQKDDPNIVGPDWASYQLKLIDAVPGPNVAFADHPPQPHFHPTTAVAKTAATFKVGQTTFSGNDLNKYMSTFLGNAGADDRKYPDTILFTNVVKKGQTLSIRNLLLHERQFFGGPHAAVNKRTFELVEHVTLVPEPSSLYLLGIGVITTACCVRRRTPWLGFGVLKE
jgi:hypothetical protein